MRLAPIVAALVLCSGASATESASSWCRAPHPPSWKRVVASSIVGLSRRASVLPIVGGGDGRSFFAELYSPAFSGVVRIAASTSHVRRIRRFPSARNDQADGSFDGRWLVWNEYHSLSGFDDFTTFAWDSHTGRIGQIGAAKRDANGAFWPSGWRQPDVRAGFATWAQGAGPDGQGEVHVYDPAANTDRSIPVGQPVGTVVPRRSGGVMVAATPPRHQYAVMS